MQAAGLYAGALEWDRSNFRTGGSDLRALVSAGPPAIMRLTSFGATPIPGLSLLSPGDKAYALRSLAEGKEVQVVAGLLPNH